MADSNLLAPSTPIEPQSTLYLWEQQYKQQQAAEGPKVDTLAAYKKAFEQNKALELSGGAGAALLVDKKEKTLGVDEFLKLLITQLKHQDPMKPMEDTAFVAQMASFSSLQQMRDLSQHFDTFASDQNRLGAHAYLGMEVTIMEPVVSGVTTTYKNVEGVVTAINSTKDSKTGKISTNVVVNGKMYDIINVQEIRMPGTRQTAQPATATGTTTASTPDTSTPAASTSETATASKTPSAETSTSA